MSRRQSKDPLERRVGALVGLAGLVVFACVFVPGVGAVFAGLLLQIIVVGVVVLALLAAGATYKRRRRKQEVEYQNAYLGAKATKGHAPAPASDEGTHGRIVRETITRDLLDALEWRRFEQLVTWYFEKCGFDAKRSRVGADGGVDILVSNPGASQPSAYVQCKAWRTYKVGVKPVRELFGVMAADGIGAGYFVTSGEFTVEALEFARGKAITLMTGNDLLQNIGALPESDRAGLLSDVTCGDYSTPTCPRCDIKMVLRSGPDSQFWGCSNYASRPSCRQTFKLRE
jgi:hypothetical protein